MKLILMLSLLVVATQEGNALEDTAGCPMIKSAYEAMCPLSAANCNNPPSPIPMTTESTTTTTTTEYTTTMGSPMPMIQYCPLKYKKWCNWLVLRSAGITYAEAVKVCADHGGYPANIYSRDHFYMLMGYSTMFAFKNGWMETWLGMTYDKDSKTVYLTDGTKAPYVKWHPNFPQASRCCQMALDADVDMDDVKEDMFVIEPTTKLRGVLCER